jgi:hypothetical protein
LCGTAWEVVAVGRLCMQQFGGKKWSDGSAVWTEGSAKSWTKVKGCADPQKQRIGRWYVHVILFL